MVAGSNLDGTRAEKNAVIAFVRSELPETDPAGMIMVGDRKYDVLGAKNNKIAAAAIGYGYGSQAELKAAEPDYLLATVQELHRFLQEN
ncbi:HAD hydrolase-like protein|uniref:HAD-hyrolase-like n=1 Tax=Dendrosporobacter quercicolus TaxID=146817 RepID=A0A1G9ZYW9_9FIRM|nr:HAD hydrolase-like protein [Dendrosporobacter quercicolus]NSL50082.1 HAD hydrolase-like protein [Dendrosporobacter quercicolus DSM 1736]SDN26448.1 HAD-hyrolase-like [Dendrosporobacter quercicolus]